MNTDDQRNNFEAWVASQDAPDLYTGCNTWDNNYSSEETSVAFAAWQAACKSTDKEIINLQQEINNLLVFTLGEADVIKYTKSLRDLIVRKDAEIESLKDKVQRTKKRIYLADGDCSDLLDTVNKLSTELAKCKDVYLGHMLVPMIPTNAVREVIRDINSDSGEGWSTSDPDSYWTELLAASTQP